MPIQKESSSEANFPINEFFTWWRIHVWMVPTKLDWSETKYLEYFQSSLLVFFFCLTNQQPVFLHAGTPSLSLSLSLSLHPTANVCLVVFEFLHSRAAAFHSILVQGVGKKRKRVCCCCCCCFYFDGRLSKVGTERLSKEGSLVVLISCPRG